MAIRALMPLAAGLALPLAAQAPRDLSGRWVLQGDRDTVPAAVAPDTAPPPVAAAPARPGGRARSDRAQLGLLLGMAGAVRSFTLHQTDSAITVTNEDGFRYTLHPGGGEDRLAILDSTVVEYRTRWDGSFLRVEWRPDGGGRLTERYQLADSGLYLRIDVSVEFERFRRSESRLYRRAEAAP